jgi:non-ribosomal peptide synthetase component E (peptide arylation enzyme)
MKELKAGIQLVRTKCIELNRHPVFKKKALQPVAVESLPQKAKVYQKSLLSFPVSLPPEGLRQRTTQGLRQLNNQAERINQLAAELEAAVLEFKALASEVNQDWKAFQAMQKPTSAIADICQYQAVHVPLVRQKSSGSFAITSRTVDLFQAEREAELLAQTLRRRANKKRHKG